MMCLILSPRGISSRLSGWFFLALLAFTLAGCGNSEKLVPVEGKVFLDSKPLSGGTLTFIPDTAKGNKTSFRLTATCQPDGSYRIETERGRGAPEGAYNVVVLAPLPTATNENAPPVVIPAKYQDEKKTALSINVVEKPAPGAYDLHLKAN